MNEILKNLLPTVASALLGPMGGLAVSAIGNILGIDNASITTITKAIDDGKITPEQLSELKKLELQYQENEKERGFRYADLEFKDREGARQMQTATHSSTPAILTYLVTLGFFGVLGAMLHDETVVNSPPILIMLGSLGTAWTGCMGFWFGSSKSSQNKDTLIASSTPGVASDGK